MDIEGVSVFISMKFQEHGYIHGNYSGKNIVFISVISMDISMNIFISAYPWGPLPENQTRAEQRT
jgi:hypothetical protein